LYGKKKEASPVEEKMDGDGQQKQHAKKKRGQAPAENKKAWAVDSDSNTHPIVLRRERKKKNQ